jgi:hypothetical protein
MNDKKELRNYTMLYYFRILQNILYKHKVRLVGYPDKMVTQFIFDKQLQKEWYDLFEIKDENTDLNFPYFMREARTAFALFDALNTYNFSLANLLHVKSSLWFRNDTNIFKANQSYRVECTTDDIMAVTNDRVCLIAKIRIFNQDGVHVYDQKNAFLIKKLKEDKLKLFDSFHHYAKHRPELFTNLSQKTSTLWQNKQCERSEINIKKSLGAYYGKLSGDMNMIHTSQLIAKSMGAKGAFIQGLCTLNLLLAKFSSIGYNNIEKLNITFCNKIYEEQTILLLVSHGSYELVDVEGKLLAYGRILRYPN